MSPYSTIRWISQYRGSNIFLCNTPVLSSELINYSQKCGLCYQNIKPSINGGWPLPHSAAALCSSSAIKRLMNQSPNGKFERRNPPRVATSEDIAFDGYRRVQVIFTPSHSFQTDPVSNQPFEAFLKFVTLFHDVKEEQMLYLADMREMETRISDYSYRQGNIPSLSFAEIKKWHKQMAEEHSCLQHAVAELMHTICSNPKRTMLVKHIFQSTETTTLLHPFRN